ncbi:hypothetical protein Coch_1743 [Capnocytophaga ochracea DSM 7271]|uniref:Uncharacterized protein n=1 Tax=Capnocytophaga ochracea (strain ATCC 27872 / DSM 7271 / CCUG 9716 / JCM 12966 / NCTC 12371 / SS31 / VPI 2845) TaxID=521097 RepID=C7M828_CAPOD|nr:hypothetical protein Coch_1743 [Capnocytophaga ochracea DSM 7271]
MALLSQISISKYLFYKAIENRNFIYFKFAFCSFILYPPLWLAALFVRFRSTLASLSLQIGLVFQIDSLHQFLFKACPPSGVRGLSSFVIHLFLHFSFTFPSLFLHFSFTFPSYFLRSFFVHSSFIVRSLFVFCSSFVRHLLVICSSFVRHLFVICSSFLRLLFICPCGSHRLSYKLSISTLFHSLAPIC